MQVRLCRDQPLYRATQGRLSYTGKTVWRSTFVQSHTGEAVIQVRLCGDQPLYRATQGWLSYTGKTVSRSTLVQSHTGVAVIYR